MFQVFFLKHVGRPSNKTQSQILENYSFSYGFAPSGMPLKLQRGLLYFQVES
jgi:hypothetical protein